MKTFRFFPLTICCVLLIFFLCFFNPPQTNLNEISNIDKIFHFLMYLGTMSIFWFEYWHYTKQYKRWKVVQCIFVALICPILMSGLIELLQEYCTNGRRGGDWWDFLANSMGVLVSWIFRKKYLI